MRYGIIAIPLYAKTYKNTLLWQSGA